ncbi:hypothetical protein ACFC1D_38890 [Streptomyces vinaceus]|uniref:hypothetical protein n=1 Tax=Streptomyces vinaceus TaxID=1960 RepID=UPI0035DCF11A
MSLSEFCARSGAIARSTVRWFSRTPLHARRALVRADHWTQDHIVLAALFMFTVFAGITTVTLRYWGEVLLAFAKEYQPLVTILWVVVSVLLAVVKFFSSRRAARLARATMPLAEVTTPAAVAEPVQASDTAADPASAPGPDSEGAVEVLAPSPSTDTITGDSRVA